MVRYGHKVSIVGLLLLGVGLLCTCTTFELSPARKATEAPTIIVEEITPTEEEEAPTALYEATEEDSGYILYCTGIDSPHDPLMLYGWTKWMEFDWSSIERLEPVVEEEIIIEEEHPVDYSIAYVCLAFMVAITVIGGINGNIRRKRWERLILEKRDSRG